MGPIASALGRLGLEVVIDVKDRVGAPVIAEQVSSALERADLSVLGLSPVAMESLQVREALEDALSLEATTGRPYVLPLLLADVAMPEMLSLVVRP